MTRFRLVTAGLVAAWCVSAAGQTSRSVELAKIWDAEHVSSPITPLVDHAEVKRRMHGLAEAAGGPLRVRQAGASIEGREIYQVSFGTGPFVVLMWSQMHGDEGTATSALFDLYEYVTRHQREPQVASLLAALTVHTVPMLNPDGAERWQRRNVQGLDINRDALLLQSPEGRLLKSLRDQLEPRVGFNLHNQSWNTTAGNPPRPASISLLSVAFDEPRTMSEGRLLTRRLGAVVRDAIEPFTGDRIGRYDDSFEVRAFGDNLTKWGTPVLLIETGPWPDERPDPALVRVNFVALVAALSALADGSVHRADPARYDALPENESRGFYVLIRNVTIRPGGATAPFTGDVGLAATRRVRGSGPERRVVLSTSVSDLGDLRTHAGLFEVDGRGKILTALVSDAAPGAILTEAQLTGGVQIGSAGDLMLLSPVSAGYTVERIFRAMEEIR
jgi:hypothetical protein